MKKNKAEDMRKEYDFSAGVPGKYADRAAGGIRVVTNRGTIRIGMPSAPGKKAAKSKPHP